MRLKLVYPKWRKLERQTPFNLPPHGPVVFAAALPRDVAVEFVDENVDELSFDDSPELVLLSVMLTAQVPRAFEIADAYRKKGVKVISGGIAAMLHSEEMALHCDSVFAGEAEGRVAGVLDDFKNNRLKKVYDHLSSPPDIASVGTARRDILDRPKYEYRGVKMLDLVHASRGCRFNCFPCCAPYLGGRNFRPRPIERVLEEVRSIPNNRLFFVDNSLAQDRGWEKELFQALAPLKKKWVSHPIEEDDELLDLAYKAGCWYVYQAIFDTSDHIRGRVKRYKDHGIGVEGTIILGMDEHDADAIRRLVDFLLEMDLDIAEFTVMTPFPHSPIRASLEKQGRITSNKWADYTCDRVVFKPARMTPSELQDMYYYCWDKFYEKSPAELRMGRLFANVVRREVEDGTYVSSASSGGRRRARVGASSGRADS